VDFSPKVTFAKGPYATVWTNIASSSEFRDAAGTAMLQMQANLGLAATNESAAANCFKMEGARQFLSVLMNLTTPPEEPPKRIRTDNLNHSV